MTAKTNGVQRAFRFFVISNGALFLLIIALGVFVYLDAQHKRQDIADQARATCVAVNNINVLITKTLQRSLHNLPRLAYFRDHPEDLQVQSEEIRRQIASFTPRTCPQKTVNH
jgi:hypothetical protein